MVGLLRLAVLGFIFLTIAYLLVSVYSRSVRREKLEKRWDAKQAAGDDVAPRDTYIEEGMKRYESGLRKRLILLIYIIPIVAVAALVYLNNFS